MTYEFCTLFDRTYLPRGLVLYRSLEATGADFRLRVLCMDQETADVLSRLDLSHVEIVPLAELEGHDEALAAVKPTRSPVEYCWTATPAVCLFCLDREPQLESITYLDADLRFFSDPGPVFVEMADASILITPHRYAPRYVSTAHINGIYNVQFVTFRRTPDGLAALRWWRDRCLEWCYAAPEDGKFGDQKYLDDWPERFAGVHVLEHPGGGLAPWNVEAHALSGTPESVAVDGRELVFYHYHSLRLHRPPRVFPRLPPPYRLEKTRPRLAWTTLYPVSPLERRLVWTPYLREIALSLTEIGRAGGNAEDGTAPLGVAAVLRAAARSVTPERIWRLAQSLKIRLGRPATRDEPSHRRAGR